MASLSWPWEPLEDDEEEPVYDPFHEQDMTPAERDFYERHKHEPEREQ